MPIPLRLNILKIVADEGPIELGRLLETFRGDQEPSRAVTALACADLLEIDLSSGPLGPSTMVRSRT
ncbi:hypothetical protein ACKWRH_37135 [Bradyrhizobium sp. Pa8]|uniref:hypothetical protein n=1 Tax=Bradyrhizobium sp. Pa8 TaxID=3386552 RepID=UPI00403F5E22